MCALSKFFFMFNVTTRAFLKYKYPGFVVLVRYIMGVVFAIIYWRVSHNIICSCALSHPLCVPVFLLLPNGKCNRAMEGVTPATARRRSTGRHLARRPSPRLRPRTIKRRIKVVKTVKKRRVERTKISLKHELALTSAPSHTHPFNARIYWIQQCRV